MITRLKKLQFLVYHRDYKDFLLQLRELGVVHLSTRQVKEGENEQIDAQVRLTKELELIVQQLKSLSIDGSVAQELTDAAVKLTNTGEADKGLRLADEVTRINNRIREVELRRIGLTAQVQALTPWGDFDPACRDIVAEAGRTLSFHSISNKMWREEWLTTAPVFVINEDKNNVYFVSIDEPVTDEGEVLRYAGATTLDLPHVRLNEAVAQLEDAQREIPHLYTDLQIIARQGLDDVMAALRESQNSVAFDSVVYGTDKEADDTLMVLTGWVPAKVEDDVRAFCEKSEAWFDISMPKPGDVVPTKMNNGRFTRLFENLTRMYGSPDYDEFDATPMIAIFFSIFFGFCVGDAGYGLVLLVLGFPLCRFLKNGLDLDINPVLVTVLGGASTIVGLVLGTAFGVSLADVDAAWINWMHPYMITGKVPGTNYDWQMVLALGIGVLHLCIAMLVKAIGVTVKYGFRVALVDWSWWLLIVAGVVVGLPMGLGAIDPEVCKYVLLGVGLVCSVGIFLLNNPDGKWYANVGGGLYATYNMATGLLGDVLSYIRLYALGLAGGMLGGVFNQLAFQVGDSNDKFGWIFCLLILVAGHVLNIAMSCLSAFVHPLRLTFVEYFKNSGYNGKGVAFRAFARA